MFSMPDKVRMRSISGLYQGGVNDDRLREMKPDKTGPLTIGEAISFIMDEPALTNRPLTVDPKLMGLVSSTSLYLGDGEEADQLRMIHFAPILSVLTRTAHVIDPGTVSVIKRGGSDSHGRKYVDYVTTPRVEYVQNDDADHQHRTFNAFLATSVYNNRIPRASICIAAKTYITDVTEILGLEVMRMEREYNTMVREKMQAQTRETFQVIEDRRVRERGVKLTQFNQQLNANPTGPEPLYDPEGEVEEDDVLVALF